LTGGQVGRVLPAVSPPQIVRMDQARLDGFNDRITALYAHAMTTRDIRAHLREMSDADVSPDLMSRVTDAVADELAEWLIAYQSLAEQEGDHGA
jgi:transposase-like protein